MKDPEIWKPIAGYEGYYEVSSHGRVRSLDRIVKTKGNGVRSVKGRILIPVKMCAKTPYHQVQISRGIVKTRVIKRIHRLVAYAFIPNPENKPFINHKDAIMYNNYIHNLEWCTPKENSKHAVENNLMRPRSGPMPEREGKNHHSSKPIVRLTLEGIFIKSYDSISLTKKDGFKSACIWSALTKSKVPIYRRFIWMYQTEYDKNPLKFITNKIDRTYHSKSTVIRDVVQLDLNNNFIRYYNKIIDVEKFGFSASGVSSCCGKHKKTHGGFRWMYKEDYENQKENL